MQESSRLAQNLQAVRTQIKAHSAEAPAPELLAVSKKQTPEAIAALFALGQRRFGENYIQELLDKAKTLADLPIEWVFIGHLQSNKIKRLVQAAHEIQTVGSLAHAQRIEAAAREYGKCPFPIMIEVNAANEEGKSGVACENALDLAQTIAKTLPGLRIKGLMAIPPAKYQDSACSEVPSLYKELRALASLVGEGELSLGMSGDLRLAIKAGTNLVRIGTAIFGAR